MAVWYGFQSASKKKLICKDAATEQQIKAGMCQNLCSVVSFLKKKQILTQILGCGWLGYFNLNSYILHP